MIICINGHKCTLLKRTSISNANDGDLALEISVDGLVAGFDIEYLHGFGYLDKYDSITKNGLIELCKDAINSLEDRREVRDKKE